MKLYIVARTFGGVLVEELYTYHTEAEARKQANFLLEDEVDFDPATDDIALYILDVETLDSERVAL